MMKVYRDISNLVRVSSALLRFFRKIFVDHFPFHTAQIFEEADIESFSNAGVL